MAIAATLGMRGTGSFTLSGQRPNSYREGILHLFPNGKAPLTAITSMGRKEAVDDPTFYWYEKLLPTQRATITDQLANASLTTAYETTYATGAPAGTDIYLQMSADDAGQFREGHVVLIRDASNLNLDTVGRVSGSALNGSSSYVSVTLLEADDNDAANGNYGNGWDSLLLMGTAHPEFGEMPVAVSQDATRVTNYTQIFRNSLGLSRTAMKTRLRTGDAYKEAKRQALEYHSIEMEKAFIWGIPTENTGANGHKQRTTGGVIYFTKTYASDNVSNFVGDGSGTWAAGGETWLDSMLEQIFRYGGEEKLALCGSGALLGIQQLAKTSGQVTLVPGAAKYGVKILQWITPFGTLNLKTHPLFSYETTNRNMMLILEPQRIKMRYIDDTHFISDKNSRNSGTLDGTKEEFLTEIGMEYPHPITGGILYGVGLSN